MSLCSYICTYTSKFNPVNSRTVFQLPNVTCLPLPCHFDLNSYSRYVFSKIKEYLNNNIIINILYMHIIYYICMYLCIYSNDCVGASNSDNSDGNTIGIIIAAVTVAILILLVIIAIFCAWGYCNKNQRGTQST